MRFFPEETTQRRALPRQPGSLFKIRLILASLRDAAGFWDLPVVSLADSLDHRLEIRQSLRLDQKHSKDFRRGLWEGQLLPGLLGSILLEDLDQLLFLIGREDGHDLLAAFLARL